MHFLLGLHGNTPRFLLLLFIQVFPLLVAIKAHLMCLTLQGDMELDHASKVHFPMRI